jgi:hypothetical protein
MSFPVLLYFVVMETCFLAEPLPINGFWMVAHFTVVA